MRLQKLNKELEDSKEELAEKEDDRRLSELQDSLDGLYSEYEDLIQSELSDIKGLLEKGNAIAEKNADAVSSTIKTYAQNYDYNGRFNNIDSGLNLITEDKPESILGLIKSIANEGTVNEAKDNNNKNNPGSHNPTNVGGLKSIDVENVTLDNEQLFKDSILDILSFSSAGDFLKNNKDVFKKFKNLEIKGFSKGGVVSIDNIEKQIKANGDTVLGSLNPDERVLTPVQNKLFEEFINNGIPELNATANMLQPLVNIPNLPNITSSHSGATQVVQIDNLSLPNVTNYEEFKGKMYQDMQHNQKFETFVRSISTDRTMGGKRLSKNSIKF